MPNIILMALIHAHMFCGIQPGRVFPTKLSQPTVHEKGIKINESNSHSRTDYLGIKISHCPFFKDDTSWPMGKGVAHFSGYLDRMHICNCRGLHISGHVHHLLCNLIADIKLLCCFIYCFVYILMLHNMIILFFHLPYFHVSNSASFLTYIVL